MQRKVNLIPMAGAGQRFIAGGYKIPKPLLDVRGKPMVVRSAESLPPADHWIFICRDEHLKLHKVDKTLLQYFPNAEIIVVKHITKGQACTCLLAKSTLYSDDQLTIGACDNEMIWSAKNYKNIIENKKIDIIVWTFKNNPSVLENPNMYGWAVINKNKKIKKISVKQPISKNPIKDQAIIGAFTFKTASTFIEATEQMLIAGKTINNEFYLDTAINFAINQKKYAFAFEVKKYVCWGTPFEYKKNVQIN